MEYFLWRSLRQRLKYPSQDPFVQRLVQQQRQRFYWKGESTEQESKSADHRASPLSVGDLQSAYVLAAFGIVLSVAAFLLEMLGVFTFTAVIFG